MPVDPDTRYRVTRLLKLYKRDALPQIDRILVSFENDPQTAFVAVQQKYGPEPPTEPLADRVRRFYEAHDRGQLSKVPDIVSKYKGRDADCIAALCGRYEVPYEPEPPTPRAVSPAPNGGTPSAAADPGGMPAVDDKGVPTDMNVSVEQHRTALTHFYQRWGAGKTAKEVDQSIQKYAPKGAEGFAHMWQILSRKYASNNAAAGSTSAAPAAQSSQQPVASADSTEAATRKELIEFYRVKGERKTDADIDKALQKYANPESGGYERMWTILENKYGPRPGKPAAQSSAGQPETAAAAPPPATTSATDDPSELELRRLREFYASKNIPKMDEELRKSIRKYSDPASGGYDRMWATLERKYGPAGAPVPQEQSGLNDSTNPQQQQQQQGQPSSEYTGAAEQEVEQQFERLRRFYAQKGMAEPDDEVRRKVIKYRDPESGGYERMWAILERKYGAEGEPAPAAGGQSQDALGQSTTADRSLVQQPQQQQQADTAHPQQQQSVVSDPERDDHRDRLKRFYRHYNAVKGDDEIETALAVASNKPNGYEKMWALLVEKYGPEPQEARPALSQSVMAGNPSGMSAAAAAPPNGAANPTDPDTFTRLRRFYDRYDAAKTDDDIRGIMKRYAASPGGFENMWRSLEGKYGPEPGKGSTAQPLTQKDRVVRFYKHYGVDKTEDEIERTIAKYATAPGGYDAMWAGLEKKYGPEPAATGEFDTVRLDPALVNESTHFITPRGLSLAANAHRGDGGQAASPLPLPAENTNVSSLSRSIAKDLAMPSRADDLSAEARRGRSRVNDPSLLHLTILFSGANYDLYDHATADSRALFREAVVRQVAANAQIPDKHLVVTRVAHGSIIVDLDYSVPPSMEAQSVAVAEILSKRVDAGKFPVAIVREAYRRHLRGNPVQLVASGITILGQALAEDQRAVSQMPADSPSREAARYARSVDVGAVLREYNASTPQMEPPVSQHQSLQQLRSLGIRSPGFDATRRAGIPGGFADVGAAAEGSYFGVDPDVRAIPAATGALADMPYHQREERRRAMQSNPDAANLRAASQHGMPSLARNVDVAAAEAMGQPWHTYDPSMSSPQRRQADWFFQQQQAVRGGGGGASGSRHSGSPGRERSGDWRDGGFGTTPAPQRAGGPPGRGGDRGFLDNLWQDSAGVGRRRGAAADRTPEALRGLGLQTSNPLEDGGPPDASGGGGGGGRPGDVPLGLIAPPGAVELHRMMTSSRQFDESGRGHSGSYPSHQGGPVGAAAGDGGPGDEPSGFPKVMRLSVGAMPPSQLNGAAARPAGGGEPSVSPVPQRPQNSPVRHQGAGGQQQYSPVPSRGQSYMYGVVDALNA